MTEAHLTSSAETLPRRLGPAAALGVNVLDMVGVGPFVTLPLIVAAMGGPQAMLGWLLGAALSLCDGCIWSELGTAYPEAGGTYAYLGHLFGPRAGRPLAFLYAWQLLLSAPLSIASGCIGFAQYAGYFAGPRAMRPLASVRLLHVPVVISGTTLLAVLICGAATLLLHRRLDSLGRLVQWLSVAVVAALVWIIVVGFTHFHRAFAFSFPPGAFHLDHAFLLGLGAGMLVSAYDYWGYYNVCFLGAEVRDPARTIPRAVLGSVLLVAALYLLMNISVLGVVPWREFMTSGATQANTTPMAVFMRRAYPGIWGERAAVLVVALIAIAAASSVLALLLGYSRIPYAAARAGNFPAIFGRVDRKLGVPSTSLRILAGITAFCCLFRLGEVITTLVVIRILFQFLLQGVAVLLPRHRRQRREPGRFRMPLYPLPAVLALAGFTFILFSRAHIGAELRIAAVVLAAGLAVFALRERRQHGNPRPHGAK